MDDSFLGSDSQRRSIHGMDRFYEQAFDMLTSSKVSAAFDLKTEPAAVREKVEAQGGVSDPARRVSGRLLPKS